MARRLKLTDQIRQAVRQSGKSNYRIWKETGIDQGGLSRFRNGTHGLSLEALDKLADCIGIKIIVVRKTKGD